MEYYRHCLLQIFGILEEYEVGAEGQKTLLEEEKEVQEAPPVLSELVQSELQQRSEEEEPMLLLTAPPSDTEEEEKEDPVVKGEEVKQEEVCPPQASKYDRLPIKVEETGEEWEEVEERWAKLSQPNSFTSGLLHWKAGGGDSTAHILTGAERKQGGEKGRRWEEEMKGGEENEKLPGGEEAASETQEGKNT